MRRAVCPGSYDPATNGHLDVIERAANLFDEVVVAVLVNKSKQGMFTISERMQLLQDATAQLPNVRVDSWHGLLTDYCKEQGIQSIVKGLRSVSDFDYELQMAQMNREISGVETLLMSNNPSYSFLSSSLVKEVATYGGDVTDMVPPVVHERLLARLAERD
ncbi:pantetheine-phosphate adenylyltransferase [Prauserella halophila]|uniref:Phosphopantetheine adenylyltransferase n=1 Tax=Prauserella halophila TaxID=185641 RepID=A0ABN1WB24_9PSEU|nr:pantetheine-phosphate adenylyltransferase [Prauserella halophila]MCP2235078.1 Phosphopantetheine adenylyltransferase [Prauserella halophila]